MSPSHTHLVTRGRRPLRSLLLFAICLAPPPIKADDVSDNGTNQSTDAAPIMAGRVFRRDIGGSEAHAYAFEMSPGQYARFLVAQQGVDLVATIRDPDGNVTTVDRPNGSRGREFVSFVAGRAGTHLLQLRKLERAAPRGSYEVSVYELREAVPRDRSRVAAEKASTEGEDLRARKTAASLAEAIEKFDQAVDLWRALDDSYEVAVALYGRCIAQRLLGNNERAITDCGDSSNTMRALGDVYGEAVAQTGRGWAHIYLGETDRALADFTSALAKRRVIGDRIGEPLDLLGIGWAHALRGEHDEAISQFRGSLAVLDELGDPRGRAIRLAAIGEVLRRKNQLPQAVEYLDQSLKLSRAAGNDRGGEAETLTNLGWCRLSLGQLDLAQNTFTEALPIRRDLGDRTGEAITLLGLAHAERGMGNLHNARLHVEAALKIIESLRAQIARRPLRLSFFALAQDYYEFYVDLLMHMHRLDPGRGHAAAALEASERARARALIDLLQESVENVRQGVPPALLERERDLRKRLNAAANYQRQLLGENASATQAAAAAKEVSDLLAALSEVEVQIRGASPLYATLTQQQTADVRAIQRELTGDTILLEYAFGRERSFLWAVSASSVTSYELPPRREIEAAASRVRASLTAREHTLEGETPSQKRSRVARADEEYPAASALLSRMVIGPAAGLLGAKRLVIVAPGALQLVPFGALPAPVPSSANAPLIATHEVTVLPSALTLVVLRKVAGTRERAAHGVTILADPVFSREDERLAEVPSRREARGEGAVLKVGAGVSVSELRTSIGVPNQKPDAGRDFAGPYAALPRLFRTRWEAEQIAALYPQGQSLLALDFDASKEAAEGTRAGASRVIHFATHAIIDGEHPELSGVALSMFDSSGHTRDGFLRAHEIFNLRLSADLVVLSACRTALGKEFKGEGLVGLARGFMYAGSPRVVGSLWATDDKATAELMVRFHRKMQKELLRPAAALRAAQVEMWRDRRWRPPYFWAGFTLQGDWR
jgi:CHAT domain-containing protein